MKLILAFRRRHFLYFDVIESALFTAVIFATLKFTGTARLFEFTSSVRDYGALFLNLASIYASLLGFIIAAAAIIFTIDSGKRIDALRQSQYFPQVFDSYLNSSFWLFLGTITMLALYTYTDPSTQPRWSFYATLFTLVVSSVTIWRALSLLRRVFGISSKALGD